MSSFQQFSFGENDNNISNRVKPFKAEAGRTYRISFIWWKGLDNGKPEMDTGAPLFVGASTNFIPNVGYVVNKGAEYTKLAGDAPRTRVATVIIIWPTDKDGNPDKTRIGRNETEVLPWVFSGEKYKSLQQIHGEFPFGNHDIKLTCSDATYQKMTFAPCKESLLKTLMGNPKASPVVAKLISEAQSFAGGINDHVGREMTIQQILEKKQGGGSSGASAAAAPVDVVATGEIDNLVDDLLGDN